ncbi:hypothetical protein [Candidatus Enterococcus mansonii]|uniref:Uncharacterized protein n=1 Tax=Candidatus Enterococcus mansonii TaxID=1834181 RepID=A0A242CEG3_9ENTE|nr:hypothetical protein [Enterococcus sp. 4G2_DIV0659]OTO08508.1 hypothetical protein A5880_001508 [Enterococcus sp. 4G2_DIV0659]
MNKHDEKAQKMKNHLLNHPTDYQTVISLFKTESDSIAYEERKRKNQLLSEIAKYKKAGEKNGK